MFFLNTAEHFTLSLSSATNDGLLVSAASPYLTAGSDPRLVEIFEAAHSVMLAILIAPQASDICVKYIPFYVDVLFKVCEHRHISYLIRRLTMPFSPSHRIFHLGSFA